MQPRQLLASLGRTGLRTAHRLGRWVAEPAGCPPGQRTGPPDFVGVGAQRSGTQWWYGLVTSHPRVCPVAARARRLAPTEAPDPDHSIPMLRDTPIRRELHFFDGFAERELEDRHAGLYRRFFPRGDGQLAGEWTPRYMLDFWTPRLLRRVAPEVRLLVLLRDPVERLLSGLSSALPVARARGVPLAWNLMNDAVVRSTYGPQLARLREHFPPDRILILQYERCYRDPARELRRTYEFLGLDEDVVPDDVRRQAGPRRPKPELRPEARDDLIATLLPDVRDVVARYPDIDLDLWPSFRGRV